jgi:hypothetical protein
MIYTSFVLNRKAEANALMTLHCSSGQRVGRVLLLLQLPSFFQGGAGVVYLIQEKSKVQPARLKPTNQKALIWKE